MTDTNITQVKLDEIAAKLKKSIRARAEEVASNIIGFTPSEAHSSETQNDFLDYTEIVEEGMNLLLRAALASQARRTEAPAGQISDERLAEMLAMCDPASPYHTVLTELQARRTQQAVSVEGEWQTIATAPKDGTRVLIASDDGEVLSLVWDVYLPTRGAPQGTEEFGWILWPGQIGIDFSVSEVIGWQPLPTPPIHTA